jgi:two-component system chemotaxis response regulator CheB
MVKLAPAMDRQSPYAVLIGGSAGAGEIVSVLLGELPTCFAPAVVVAIHQPRRRPGVLADSFARVCRLPLREPQDKEPIEPSTVYVAPPDYHLLIDPGPVFSLSVDEPVHFSRPSIDVLFESAADVLGPLCAAALLSGANADGGRGLATIHEAGGLAVVQSPQEAAHRTMPDAALAICPGIRVLASKEIGRWLVQLSANPVPSEQGMP